jgi:integrase
MSYLDLVTVATPQPLPQEMLKDHEQILQNHYDTLRARGLSPRTIEENCVFTRRWFEKIRVKDTSGERQLYVWEAMKPIEGRMLIKEFLMTLSTVDDDNQPCVRPATARAYAGKLERLFISTLESPYIIGLQTIASKYGPIENPFTGVQYPVHTRDHLRSERFFLTPEQILGLLVFLREVYPGVTNRNSTAARLYAIVMLITETGMRSIEILNLDALGDGRDIFYDKNVIQTRFGKGHNSSGPQARLMPLTDRAAITLKQYEEEVRREFRNYLTEPSLFLTLKGKRLSYDTMRTGFSQFTEVARKHGVDLPPNLTIHDLRASFATNFIEENPNKFWELMELMGHVSHSSTLLYIRSRGKNRLASMKHARGLKPGGKGFAPPVYNK